MTVFGLVVNLPHQAGTIVFIVVLILLLILEGALHQLEHACSHNGLHGLVKKLYKEFMLLGIISFAIFILTEAYDYDPYDQWFLSFEFAHIVMLFVGINFVFESVLLVILINGRNKALLQHDNSSSEQLLLEYLDLQKDGGIMKYLFDYGLVSIPLPELREKIEYKIIQEYFVRSYNLPAEFKFANYLCTLLKSFVFSLIEVRPISWLVIAGLVVLNYARIKIIDPIYESDVCHKFYTHFHHQPSEHYGEHVCQEYTLRYIFVCSMFLTFYCLGVFAASEIYMQRLIGKVLDEEELLEQLEKEEEQAHMGGSGGARIGGVLTKKDSNYSDLGDDVIEDFMVEASKNMSINATNSSVKYTNISTLTSATAAAVVADDTEVPNSKHSTSEVDDKVFPTKALRKVSYGDVNRVSLKSNGSGASSGGSDNESAERATNATSTYSTVSGFGTLGTLNGKAELSDSLKYDLQSEDGDSLLAKREAAATLALDAVQKRKNLPTVATPADGAQPEKQLRRSISEFNVNTNVTTRRHLYSLCLQRIMMVEFEYLAHQSRTATAPPPPPTPKKALGNAKASMFRRLGSAFFSAPSADAADAALASDLEKAASNSVKQSFKQVRSLAKQSFLQSTYNMSSVKSISPQELVSGTSLSRRRSALSMRDAANASDAGGFGNTSSMAVGSSVSRKSQAATTTTQPTVATIPAARSEKAPRTYSAHFFEMEPSTNSGARRIGSRGLSSMNLTGSKDSVCGKISTVLSPVYRALRHGAMIAWNLLMGIEEESPEDVDEDVAAMQADLYEIFVFKSPLLYFFTVEFALLAQCLYLALWATNFVVLARDSYFPKLWEAALLVPVPLNFWLIQKIIFSACTLKAVVSLDRNVADKICEEALDARNVTERLRKIIRSTLAGLNFEKIKWNGFLHEQFHVFKKEGAVGITEKDMRLFLHSLQIFLTATSVSRIFSVIDFDRDGKVTWKDLSDIVFPELAQQQLKVNRKANSGKSMKSVKGGKSRKNGNKSSPAAPISAPKRGTFGASSSEKIVTPDQVSAAADALAHIQSFRPSAALSGKGAPTRVLSTVDSARSADFGLSPEEEKEGTEYTTTKQSPVKMKAGGVVFAEDTATDASSDEGEGGGFANRYDEEDAEFGERYVNHRNLYLRNKLNNQKKDQEDGFGGEVIYNEDTDDFWENAGDSPLAASGTGSKATSPKSGEKKRSRFLGF